MKKNFIIPVLIFFCLLCLCNVTFADIYKYLDEAGKEHLTNVPLDCTKQSCTEAQKTIKYIKILEEKRILPVKKESSKKNNKSVSGNYEYTQDIEKENKNKKWSELRKRIGEIYEVRPNIGEEPINFYEKNNSQLLEFIVTKKEKFTIVDGFIKPMLSSDRIYWLSSSDTWPHGTNKYDSFTLFRTVIYEIIFESGKIAYLAVEYSMWDKKIDYKLNHRSIKFVKKTNKEQINKLIQESRQRNDLENDDDD